MRILSVHLQNFGSYKELNFDFQNQGLTLIQGPTGAGKSTLMDVVPWILFGETAKGGKVDEIRSWNTSETTTGNIRLDSDKYITRSRSPNDLFIKDNSGQIIRGKDLNDTQRIIDSLLGLDCERYLSGSYFHEFSQTAQFFTTSAKSRRELCEQIVDLGFVTNLQTKTKDLNKEIQSNIANCNNYEREEKSKLALFQRLQVSENTKAKEWEANQEKIKKYAQLNYDKFEANRKQFRSGKCSECGTQLHPDKESINTAPNPYAEKLLELETAKNPYHGAVKDYQNEIKESYSNIERSSTEIKRLSSELSDVETLSDVLNIFRDRLIKDTVRYIAQETNQLLNKHFDAELNIELLIENDKLDVTIRKDGNIAAYTQLSKGQRQLLKLCFSVAVMKTVRNHSGVKFHQLFFDESLDGLSDTLKIKAFSLFETLQQEYESVFVIDHSEGLKTLFSNQYLVSLNNGNSEICRV